MGIKNRKAALVTLSRMYTRVSGIDQSKCVYCGDDRYCLDHVPPLKYIYSDIDVLEYLKRGGKLFLYPSCSMCNSFLGYKKLPTVEDRLVYLYNKYMKLSTEHEWSDDDISELGENLKKMIFSHEQTRRMYDKKLRGVSSALASLCLDNSG